MTIGFELTYPDVLAFTRHFVRTGKTMRRARRIMIVFGVVFFIGIAWWRTPREAFVGGLVGAIVLSGIYILLVNILTLRLSPVGMAKRLITNPENANLIGYRKMTFTEEGIEVKHDKLDSKMSWAMIVKLGDTGTHYLLYTGENQALIIPKQRLAPADVETLNSLLKAHHLL